MNLTLQDWQFYSHLPFLFLPFPQELGSSWDISTSNKLTCHMYHRLLKNPSPELVKKAEITTLVLEYLTCLEGQWKCYLPGSSKKIKIPNKKEARMELCSCWIWGTSYFSHPVSFPTLQESSLSLWILYRRNCLTNKGSKSLCVYPSLTCLETQAEFLSGLLSHPSWQKEFLKP